MNKVTFPAGALAAAAAISLLLPGCLRSEDADASYEDWTKQTAEPLGNNAATPNNNNNNQGLNDLPPNGMPPNANVPTSTLPAYEPVWREKPSSFVGEAPKSVACQVTSKVYENGKKETLPLRKRGAKASWKPHTSGHTIAVHGDNIHALDRINGTLVTLDRVTLKVTAVTGLGKRPHQMVVHPDGSVFVTLRELGEVVRVRPVAGSFATPLVQRAVVGGDAYGLALNPAGTLLAVTLRADNALAIVDPSSMHILASKDVPARPGPVAIDSQDVAVVGHAHGPLTRGKIGVFAGSVTLDILKDRTALNTETLGSNCAEDKRIATRVVAIDVDPESGDVRAVHDAVNSGDAKGSVEGAKQVSAFFPNGEPQTKVKGGYGGSGSPAQKCTPIPRRRPAEMAVSHVRKDGKLQPYAGGGNVLGQLRVQANGKTFASLGTVALGDWIDQAADVRHHPTAAMAFVVGRGSERIIAFSTDLASGAFMDPKAFDNPELPPSSNPQIRGLGAVYSSGAPNGIAFSADGSKAYVLHEHGFSVGEINLAGVLANNAKLPFTLCETRATQFGTDPLPHDAAKGRRLFTYSLDRKVATNGNFACETCHPDGSEDGMVWHLNIGPRQTPALGGRVAGTGPFNWNGTEHTLMDNMQRTMQRMGGQGMSKEERGALKAFLESGLPSQPRTHKPHNAALVAEGKKVFFDPQVGCGSCHIGGTGTDGNAHNVGTTGQHEIGVLQILREKKRKLIEKKQKIALGPDPKAGIAFDTPTLKGLRYTAPYLHDGRAPTLMDVLEQTAGKMGDVTKLTPYQKKALVAYLMTL